MTGWNPRRWLIFILPLTFAVLLFSGSQIFQDKPPIPSQVESSGGRVLMTRESIQNGQRVFLRNQLADYGTILGHGAYFGPDFTAESIHVVGEVYTGELKDAGLVRDLFKTNRYDPASDRLVLDPVQTRGAERLESWYRERIRDVWPRDGVHIKADEREIGDMVGYLWWTAWVSTTLRPGQSYTYTNNWPYDPVAGNTVSADAVIWSGISVAVLIVGVALLTMVYFRADLGAREVRGRPQPLQDWEPTASQRKSFKYFALAGVLFLVQVLLGGYLAHAYVEPDGFYGIDLTSFLPFNLARGLHLQLAIFWIALCFLGMGLFVAPMIGGREPRGQGLLVDVLFGAVVLVAVGSMAGEVATIWGLMPGSMRLLGSDGWEYMELGYAWRALLFGGLLLWAAVVIRGIWGRLVAEEDRLGLVHLFAYACAGLGLAYGASLLFDSGTHISIAEYWRFWVIHLWVEGTFEVFAIVVMGLMFVAMGLVEVRSLARALQFQILILMGSGVIGTGHHLYFTGSPAWLIGLAACFSALEVVPLTLLCIEAGDQYRTLARQERDFAYAPVFWCLIAVGLWNFYGAGVLGFLINQPAVSYFQMGSWFTAAHGHGALMGVYGFLAIAMMMFVARGVLTRAYAADLGAFRHAFWALNGGLFLMVNGIIAPIGYLQLRASVEGGFWLARTREFYQDGLVHGLLWLRLVPDLIFLYGTFRLALYFVGGLGALRTAGAAPSKVQESIPEQFVTGPADIGLDGAGVPA